MAATASPPPTDYKELLSALQRQVCTSQAAARQAVNAEMFALYRTIGRSLLDRVRHGWSAEIVDRMGADLRAQFPDLVALSAGNLDYMRRFAEAWPDPATAPPLEHLPWGHIRVLLDEVSDPQGRDWYAAAAVRYGWSEDVLRHQILNRSHLRAQGTEEDAGRFQALPALDPDRLRADIDAIVDQDLPGADGTR